MKKILCYLLIGAAVLSVFSGCGGAHSKSAESLSAAAEEAYYVAPDGDPENITCKGSYLAEPDPNAVAARCGDGELTMETLQALYSLEVLGYLDAGKEPAPDMSLPLSQQPCPVDSAVNTWQQYFLAQALSAWHTAQALCSKAKNSGLPVEDAFQPNLDNYAEYMTGMPATKFLYRYESSYSPNSMHQAFLDGLGSLLSQLAADSGFSSAEALADQGLHTSESALLDAAKLYNTGYMYLTTMEEYLLPSDEEISDCYQKNQQEFSSRTGTYADIRHILLKPGPTVTEDGWDSYAQKAQQMLHNWSVAYRSGEASFAQLAHDKSDDQGSSLQGGLYWHVAPGDLIPELNDWVFDPQRQAGDTTVLRTDMGFHILYYAGGNTQSFAAAKDALVTENLRFFVQACREEYPIQVDYSEIVLAGDPEPGARITYSDILYPDVAHERFPEVPLYLQQDYGNLKYGNYLLRTYGCGITSLAMLSSYMTDTELTPPIMCARYGQYCSAWGTDYMIFRYEPPAMGYYLREQVFDPDVAYQALQDGYIVISCQQKGYWTKTGHYIVLEKMDEKGVQVRDSNIYNYSRIPAHKEDRHEWSSITGASVSYWIFEKKPVRSDLCARCGSPEKFSSTILASHYVCRRCSEAMVRRNCYLGL